MRIGVIGGGSFGGAMAAQLAAAGHDVSVASRDSSRGPSYAEGSQRAEAVVLAGLRPGRRGQAGGGPLRRAAVRADGRAGRSRTGALGLAATPRVNDVELCYLLLAPTNEPPAGAVLPALAPRDAPEFFEVDIE